MAYDPKVLFTSTAPYYARHRAGYPPEFFAHLTRRLGLDGNQTVLDLGCGPGMVARPLAAKVAHVIAVDPEPTMLTEGARLAVGEGLTNIDWVEADAARLPELGLPSLDLVTMGSSFHWMQRDQVLVDLDRLVAPGGAVVVVSGGGPGDGTTFDLPPWSAIVDDLRARYLGPRRRAGTRLFVPVAERHETVLARSPFSTVERVTWGWEQERDLDDVVGLQFSYSFSAPALFGGRKAAFEADLRHALSAAYPHGRFVEPIRTECLIATR